MTEPFVEGCNCGATSLELCARRRGTGEGDPCTFRPAGRHADVRALSGFATARVTGLHDLRVPFGKVTVLAGEPKLGKSQYALLLAAELARAGDHSLLITVEDDPSDTIKPRLMALGLKGNDLDGVSILQAHRVDEAGRQWDEVIYLPDDLGLIEDALAGMPTPPKLLVIDPIGAHTSDKVNGWNEGELRRALGPLQYLAQRTGLAVLVVAHLNKSVGTGALYRVAGSIGLVGAARSVLFFARDPDDENARLLAHTGNLKPAPVLRYRIEEVKLGIEDDGPPIEIPRLVLAGEAPEHDLASLASAAGGKHDAREAVVTPRMNAAAWLTIALSNGEWHESKGLKVAAENTGGINKRTLERAAFEELGVERKQEGFPALTYWRLPQLRQAQITGTVSTEETACLSGFQS